MALFMISTVNVNFPTKADIVKRKRIYAGTLLVQINKAIVE